MKLPKTAFPFIFYFARQQWFEFLIAAVASLAWGGYSALFPYFLKNLVNVLGSAEMPLAQRSSAAISTIETMVFLLIGCNILLRLQGFLFSVNFCPRFRANIREALFQYVQTHSTSYFATHFSGTLANKISDVPTNCETILTTLCYEFITAFMMALMVVITMWVSHPLFALFLIFWLCLHFFITFLFLKKGNRLLERHAEAVTTLSGKIVDVFTNIQNVKIFARNKEEQSYLRRFQQEEIECSRQASRVLEWMQVGFSINLTFLIGGMLMLLLYGWHHGSVNVGDFTQIMMQSFWLSGWMWFISHQIQILIKSTATINSALSLIQKPHDILDAPDAPPLVVTQGEIRFDQVTFSYPEKPPVFKSFDITIAPGEKIGLVGLSGAGKTTFMNLILRLYDLQAGKILIDGQSIAAVTQQSLHENIAVIPQDATLFHRTLLENIRYGRLEATEEEVIAAAKQAHCHEFIEQLDAQYQSLVGERGVKLSGGQRQRIAIARALLKNAPILILDEATSSLDSVTEKKIQESLHCLMKNRTTIAIAHRLSTLAAMDRILVFHQGTIVEDGSIQTLLQSNGYFAKLWKIQQEQHVAAADSLQ